MSAETASLAELRQQAERALRCDDREHLDSSDLEAPYDCQVEQVVRLVVDGQRQVLQRLLDQRAHPRARALSVAKIQAALDALPDVEVAVRKEDDHEYEQAPAQSA
jgi:hypothetical protein